MVEQQTGGVCGKDFGFCYNPEFIALGNVVRGLLEPDMVLIGESDPSSGERLEALYKKYNSNRPHIARMSLTSAELTKISVNSYITAKISFTNQLRMIAEEYPDTDIEMMLDAIGADSRIGHKYLRAGLSYGGPCFPRDNRLVSYAAKQVGLAAPLAEATDAVNELAKNRLAQQAIGLCETWRNRCRARHVVPAGHLYCRRIRRVAHRANIEAPRLSRRGSRLCSQSAEKPEFA